MKRLGAVAVWVLAILVAFVMVGSGIEKFIRPAWARMFRVWGYPEHFYIVVALVEIIAGAAILVPKFASAAALPLILVMIGAAYTQMTHGGSGFGEIMLMTFLAAIAYARWPGVLSRLSRRTLAAS